MEYKVTSNMKRRMQVQKNCRCLMRKPHEPYFEKNDVLLVALIVAYTF